MTPLSAVGLCCVLLARKYTLKRNVVKAGEQKPGSAGTHGTQQGEGKVEVDTAQGEPDTSQSAGNDGAATEVSSTTETRKDIKI
jgi:hypothetical protein